MSGLLLQVEPPLKTPAEYEIPVTVSSRAGGAAALVARVRALLARDGFGPGARLRYGFRAVNFRIAHHEIWDSVVPLMLLTRNHGPLFRRRDCAATVRFRYPILERVAAFFVRRAAQMGISLTVEAETFDRTYDAPGTGHIIAFGSGKESRLLLGLLRELGRAPRTSTGGRSDWPPDVSQVERSDLVRGVPSERTLPALMAGAADFYYGSGLAEVHRHEPWHQYYERASPVAQAELSTLLREHGMPLTLHAPLAVLPPNLIQRILAQRYPELYQHQSSVRPESTAEKNLDVSLGKLYHDLPFTSHCSEGLFQRLVTRFVRERLRRPDDFGHRRRREVHHREMQAMIWRRRDHRLLRHVRHDVPAEWDGPWIDGIHTYVNPSVDQAMLSVFRMYAPDYVPGPGAFRLTT